jgi:hypothetical protein
MPAPRKTARNISGESSRGSKIPAEARQQPDVYAAAFATALLTQDYRRPRADLLDAIAAEGTTTAEPLVVGLVPAELRDRLPVFSVTDTTTGNGVAAVPDAAEWSMLAARQAYTTVEGVRVSEPIGWTNAVAAGRITDPGITARDVTATVTLHQTVDGHPLSTTTSVAFTANFEGPPTLPTWRFVTLAQYTAIQTGQTGPS